MSGTIVNIDEMNFLKFEEEVFDVDHGEVPALCEFWKRKTLAFVPKSHVGCVNDIFQLKVCQTVVHESGTWNLCSVLPLEPRKDGFHPGLPCQQLDELACISLKTPHLSNPPC